MRNLGKPPSIEKDKLYSPELNLTAPFRLLLHYQPSYTNITLHMEGKQEMSSYISEFITDEMRSTMLF